MKMANSIRPILQLEGDYQSANEDWTLTTLHLNIGSRMDNNNNNNNKTLLALYITYSVKIQNLKY